LPPLARGASAKSLMAFMAPARLQGRLHELAGQGVDAAALARDLEAIRAAGYAVSDSEVDAGVWGCSAPVFERPHQAAGSVTLMAPSTRVAERTANLINLTLAAAKRISSRLQHS
ncbi:IclR family transcriptional regulator domain-containing protein, partial [Bordetella pertussis]